VNNTVAPRTATFLILLLSITIVLITSCAGRTDESDLPDERSTYLFSVYTNQARSAVPGFAVVNRLARQLRSSDEPFTMVQFLTTHVQRFPMDPNNGSYLIYLGDYYRSAGSPEVAHDYYSRALIRYPELIQNTQNSHVAALNRLLDISVDPLERITFYRELLVRFPDFVDPGRTYYYLAGEYEKAGLWDDAYDAYAKFLDFPDSDIPGEPEAASIVTRKLAFYRSAQNWVSDDLDVLVQSIKEALWSQNTRALLAHKARENFFTMSWEQELNDENSQIPTFDIGFFLRQSRVRYDDELDLASNAREAYLRTWGWSHRIPTWYLYFRRVDFPSDPEINGTWEWAGIYFGEAL